MKYALCLVVMLGCWLVGCGASDTSSDSSSTSASVLCVAAQGDFKPDSESALLAELNAQLSFKVRAKDFIADQKSSGWVGWAVVRSEREKNIAKAKLEKSATLKLVQVEALTPEFEAHMKQRDK